MLKKLTVKAKLRIYFFSLAFFILLISVSAIFLISRIGRSAESLYSHPFQVSVASIETESEIRKMFNIMQVMVSSTDLEVINEKAVEIDEIELVIEYNIDVIHEFYLGDINSISEFEDAYASSKTYRDTVINHLKNEDFQEARGFMESINPIHMDLLLNKIGVIEMFASEKADELREEAENQTSLYISIVIGVSTVIMLSSVILVVFVIKDLIPPLDRLLETIESYKSDENKSVLDLDRQDELGTISNSFNEMLDFMKTKQEMDFLDLELSKMKSTKELHKTQLLLKASLESPKDIIILSLDTEYKYMFFNDTHRISMKAAYGADVKEGKCIFDYMTSEDDIKRIKENYDRALSGETHIQTEQYGDREKSYYEIVFHHLLEILHRE